MRALVTGGAGFIGSHMVERLLAAGCEVVVLDHRIAGKCLSPATVARLVGVVEGDATDAVTVRRAVEGCERVFHFAALVGVEHYARRPVATMEVEERALAAVCDAALAAGCKKVVYASSSAVYGQAAGTVAESMEVAPTSNYAIAKRFNELALAARYRQDGLNSVACRIFNVYGPGQDERLVIPRFIRLGLAGQPLAVNGDGEQRRDFPFIDDVVEALWQCAEKVDGCEAVNVATGTGQSIRALAQAVIALTGRRSALDFLPVPEERRAFEVDSCIGDTAKLERLTGFRPAIPLAEGLARTVAWWAARAR